jgi:hypothetical protein
MNSRELADYSPEERRQMNAHGSTLPAKKVPLVVAGELTVLHIEPGDVVTVQLRNDATDAQVADLGEWWEDHVDDVPLLIFRKDESVQVTKPDRG